MQTFCFSNLTFLLLLFPLISFSQIKDDTTTIAHILKLAIEHKNSNPDSMLYFSEKAIRLAINSDSEEHLSRAYQQMADYYMMKENYGKATENILKALKIEENRSNISQVANLYDELGRIYSKMEKFQKALNYFSKALELYQKKADSINIAKLLSHIGKLHGSHEYCENRTVEQKRFDYSTAIEFFHKSLGIYNRNNSEAGLIPVYLNLASVYNRFEKSDKALPYVLKAMDYYKKENDPDGIASTLYNLGITYRKLKQFDKSISYFKETIRYGKEQNILEGIQFVYEELAQAYYEAGDYKSSRDNYVQYMILRDSIYSLEKSNQIFELETKYQTEKKEKQILSLTLDKNKKQQHVYILLLVLIILGLSSSYFIYHAKTRTTIAEQINKLNEQKIKEMEKERQLIAVHAVLHGEENERTRLARDLHDGLGGLLSGLKLSLTSMKGNVLLSQENLNHFNHALGLLDNSMKELRRVAHNMMPEALTKFGIKDALTDFCAGLANSKVEIKFRFYGNGKRLDHNYEINLYRIAQELINNSIKHASATEIVLLIVQEEQRIHLTVQDNGIGFDLKILDKSTGLGIANIRSRVEALNGKLEIFSESGKGTEVGVEFFL